MWPEYDGAHIHINNHMTAWGLQWLTDVCVMGDYISRQAYLSWVRVKRTRPTTRLRYSSGNIWAGTISILRRHYGNMVAVTKKRRARSNEDSMVQYAMPPSTIEPCSVACFREIYSTTLQMASDLRHGIRKIGAKKGNLYKYKVNGFPAGDFAPQSEVYLTTRRLSCKFTNWIICSINIKLNKQEQKHSDRMSRKLCVTGFFS